MNDIQKLKWLANEAQIFAGMNGELSPAQEDFISAANPAAVLELIAEITKLRQEAQGLRGFHARQNIYLKIAEALCDSDYERAGIDWDYECSLHEKIEAIRTERDHLKAENEALRQSLSHAADEVESWGGYASEYFQRKHDLAGTVTKIRQAAAIKESAQ